jgi:hypothetical protein
MTKRRFGYLVWGTALAVLFIPEALAASSTINRHLPFRTISETVGHLEYVNASLEIVVTALIVFSLVSLLRVPPNTSSGGHTTWAPDESPHRTAGGRITFRRTPATMKTAGEFDDDQAPFWLIVGALLSFILLALATSAAWVWWPDPNVRFHTGYVLYGGIALIWLVLPAFFALLPGADAPFPTLFRTVTNVERWLRGRTWPRSLGPVSAWFLVHVIVWGLVFLLLHLTLYPFPNITHILNPTGG